MIADLVGTLGGMDSVMNRTVYLDNNATTRTHSDVRRAMVSALESGFGNASSVHSAGDRAREIIREARVQVARLVDAEFEDIVFTSGGTEANTLALTGFDKITPGVTPKVVTSPVEHSSVRASCENLQQRGVNVEIVPVDSDGIIDLDALKETLRQPTSLVSIQWINNETGVIQPIKQISRLCDDASVPLHGDAAQAIGKIPISFRNSGIDLLSLTAHKIHGPPGIGALVSNRKLPIHPLIEGGDQEFGVRGGTENLPGIAGFGSAADRRAKSFDKTVDRLTKLRDSFEQQVTQRISDVVINGGSADRVCNTTNLRFKDVDGQALVIRLDQAGVQCSQSSACTNQRPEPSYVLRAMGLDETAAYESARFAVAEDTTMDDLDFAVTHIVDLCEQLRKFRRPFFLTRPQADLEAAR